MAAMFVKQAFNHYFTNVAAKVDEEIPRTRKASLHYLGKIQSLTIEAEVGSIKKGKYVEPYNIPCNLLKMLNPFISPLIASLINESFSNGVFPDKLKIAKVIALHKKGATNNLSNY